MIIELERYNEIGGLLIEIRATGSQGHICYQDGGQRVFVTMELSAWRGRRWGCKHDTGAHTVSL